MPMGACHSSVSGYVEKRVRQYKDSDSKPDAGFLDHPSFWTILHRRTDYRPSLDKLHNHSVEIGCNQLDFLRYLRSWDVSLILHRIIQTNINLFISVYKLTFYDERLALL